MLKNLSRVLSAVICAGLMLAACGGGNALAADLTFKATDGQVFGTQNVYRYDFFVLNGGYVKVTSAGGGENLFVDGGNLSGRILQALPQLVNIPGTNTYIDPTVAARVACVAGASTMALQNSGAVVQVSDNCALFAQIQAKAK